MSSLLIAVPRNSLLRHHFQPPFLIYLGIRAETLFSFPFKTHVRWKVLFPLMKRRVLEASSDPLTSSFRGRDPCQSGLQSPSPIFFFP